MAWILMTAVAPVSYLEEQLGFTSLSVTFKKSLALPSWSRSAGAGAPVAPGWDNLPPTQVLMGSGFLTCFPLPYNAPENCYLRIYLGLSFAGSLAFNQRQMFLGRGKRSWFIGLGHLSWPQSCLALTTQG